MVPPLEPRSPRRAGRPRGATLDVATRRGRAVDPVRIEVTRATSVTSPLRGFVVCARMLEPLLADELATLLGVASSSDAEGTAASGPAIRESRGGVFWSGDARTAAEIVYGARLASRVLLERIRVRAAAPRLDADALYALLRDAPWEQVLTPGASIAVTVHPRRASIANRAFAAQRVKDAIVDRWRALGQARPDVDRERPDCPLVVVVDGGDVVVSQDLTGEALFRRGLRVVETEAPLREDVAAGVLIRAGWSIATAAAACAQPATPEQGDACPALVDPMCGSGTLVSEAVLIALDVAPGLVRQTATDGTVGDPATVPPAGAIRAPAQIRSFGLRGESAVWESAERHARGRALDRLRARLDARLADGRWPVVMGADVDPRAVAAARARWSVVAARLLRWFDGVPVSEHDRRARAEDVAAQDRARAEALRRFLRGVEWREAAIAALAPPAGAARASFALLVANPPWGTRLGGDGSAAHGAPLATVYADIGRALEGPFSGWTGAIVSAWPGAAGAVRVPWSRRYALCVGATEAALLLYAPDAQPRVESAARLSASAREVYNRLTKVWSQRLKVARRAGWSSFRLYDTDLPEYAFAVDVYHEDWTPPDRPDVADDALAWSASLRRVVAAEYAPPPGVDPVRAARRRAEFLRALRLALDVPRERVFLKTRARQRGTRQYQRVAASADANAVFWVREGRARVKVDLVTHLDTGLFLDHRTVRQWVAEALRERAVDGRRPPRFLNLFAYTGTASVHAALAGAATVSVDLSPVYLEWAAENLVANGFVPAPIEHPHDARRAGVGVRSSAARSAPRRFRRREPGFGSGVSAASDPTRHGESERRTPQAAVHRLVRADVLTWLDVQSAGRPVPCAPDAAFDVILVDPPSFSTSKRMQGAFDVQRDHVALIDAAMRLLRRDGLLVFSNNLRRFKLDPALGARYRIVDRSAPSIPADFARDPRIHHCWWVRWPDAAEPSPDC